MRLLRIIQWCVLSNTRTAFGEEATELGRYRADLTAALAPYPLGALCGALAGVVVFFVPIAVVGGSMLLLNLTFNFGIVPLRLLVRLFNLKLARTAPAGAVAGQLPPTPRPTEVAPLAPEGPLPGDGDPIGAMLLVLFWPIALLAIGALVAWLYQLRRRRALPALRGAPVDVSILPEVALFYALTAAAGLLVGVGSFVALGANVVFAWAGYLSWRWL